MKNINNKKKNKSKRKIIPTIAFSSKTFEIGIFIASQCTQTLLGASGSSMIAAKEEAEIGIFEISNSGLIFSPSKVYLRGIEVLFSKAGEVI